MPLLVAVAIGIWLWRGGGGFAAADHQLVFQMPEDRAAMRRFEYQLYAPDGELLKREEFELPNGAEPDLVPRNKLALKDGRYDVRVFRWNDLTAPPTASIERVDVTREEQVVVRVPPQR